jgi:hypothetical protein
MATARTLTWAQTAALNPYESICLACGADLIPILARLGSLRCHVCRARHAPLDPDLAAPHPRRTHD